MPVRIPSEKHPYRNVEDNMRVRDPYLALVRNERRGTWMILQETRDPVPTLPMLRGIPGIEGKTCNWTWVFTIWDTQGRPLCPADYHSRILWALDQMNVQRAGGLTKYLDQIELMNEEVREAELKRAHSMSMDIAKDSMKWHGRIISTPVGTVNVKKMYDRHIPVCIDGQNKMVEREKWLQRAKRSPKSLITS